MQSPAHLGVVRLAELDAARVLLGAAARWTTTRHALTGHEAQTASRGDTVGLTLASGAVHRPPWTPSRRVSQDVVNLRRKYIKNVKNINV